MPIVNCALSAPVREKVPGLEYAGLGDAHKPQQSGS